MCRLAKIANTDTMTIAALVTVPAESVIPTRIAARVDKPWSTASRIRLTTKTW